MHSGHPKYKTRWCDFHFRSHGCRFGDNCNHAHSYRDYKGPHFAGPPTATWPARAFGALAVPAFPLAARAPAPPTHVHLPAADPRDEQADDANDDDTSSGHGSHYGIPLERVYGDWNTVGEGLPMARLQVYGDWNTAGERLPMVRLSRPMLMGADAADPRPSTEPAPEPVTRADPDLAQLTAGSYDSDVAEGDADAEGNAGAEVVHDEHWGAPHTFLSDGVLASMPNEAADQLDEAPGQAFEASDHLGEEQIDVTSTQPAVGDDADAEGFAIRNNRHTGKQRCPGCDWECRVFDQVIECDICHRTLCVWCIAGVYLSMSMAKSNACAYCIDEDGRNLERIRAEEAQAVHDECTPHTFINDVALAHAGQLDEAADQIDEAADHLDEAPGHAFEAAYHLRLTSTQPVVGDEEIDHWLLSSSDSSENPWDAIVGDDILSAQEDDETMNCPCGVTFPTDADACPECLTPSWEVFEVIRIKHRERAYLESITDITVALGGTADSDDAPCHITRPVHPSDRLAALAVEQQWEADYEAAVWQWEAAEATADQMPLFRLTSRLLPMFPLMPRGLADDASVHATPTEMSCADDLHFGDPSEMMRPGDDCEVVD